MRCENEIAGELSECQDAIVELNERMQLCEKTLLGLHNRLFKLELKFDKIFEILKDH